MSRIGKKPVPVPDKATATLEGQHVKVKGPKGELSFTVPDDVKIEQTDAGFVLTPVDESKKARSMWGMSRTMVANLMQGVTDGFTKTLEIQGVGYRAQYQKPILYDECKYEGNIPQGWGNLDAKTMTQRFWLGTLSGCYVGHGETYLHPDDIIWWSKGGVLHGESPRRIQWLKDLMAAAPPFDQLQPMGDDQGRAILAQVV